MANHFYDYEKTNKVHGKCVFSIADTPMLVFLGD